jgi:hypothetical protein
MPWRARCRETGTAGSASGLEKRTVSNHGTALQADSTKRQKRKSFPIAARPRCVTAASLLAGDNCTEGGGFIVLEDGQACTAANWETDASLSVSTQVPSS